jgi:flagellar hook assembly protein FlgD
MKIQIMTISGKVVREIEMNELGPIRIGRNITEFTWDGTDQYGDRLANGLYFYRVVASNNGRQLEKLETSADKYFKSGLGKMYMIK